VVQGHSFLIRFHASAWVHAADVPQRIQKIAAEVADTGLALSELIIESGPGNELRPLGRYAVQPLGEPGVHIESER
jgi:hypothetical protein